MTSYERLFGTGPRGLAMSLALLVIFILFENKLSLPEITNSDILRYSIFTILSVITAFILFWSVKSLPPTERGNNLVTAGAFKYFRHPLYGAFLTFFNFGLAVLLNNWAYIIWAVTCHPIWHWNIKGEENLMESAFPNEYNNYCNITGRFFPRILNNKT